MTFSDSIQKFIQIENPSTPCVILDINVVDNNYEELRREFPEATIYYAVKANPGKPILNLLQNKGCCFDIASLEELDLLLEYGADPSTISYGSTIKKEKSIQYAYQKGVRLFAYDSFEELEKLSRSAPGAKTFCRILWECKGSEWPLSKKFGCDPKMAVDLLIKSSKLGLVPYGISFHPGSQQHDTNQWELGINVIGDLFEEVHRRSGIQLQMINLGGGLPTRYCEPVPPIRNYIASIRKALDIKFPGCKPKVIIEPGRYIVGNAGVILTEIVLISRKSHDRSEFRWIYLDIGVYSGLAETINEAIKYPITSERDGDATEPVILAGPTCDSFDTLYEKVKYELPLSLKIGDILQIHSAGAYTTTYPSVGFNGFLPPKIYYI